jgi:23S rRNA pseudouridine1911/1915/1917 synthase
MSGLPEILFEDNHILIVNKRTGDIVQGDKTGDIALTDLLKAYLKEKYHKPGEVFLGLVHRIDRPVSGAVILARTSKALTRLSLMVKNREIKKTYWAIVDKVPEPVTGRLENHLRKNEKQNKSYIVAAGSPEAKLAILDYKLIASSKSLHLLEVDLITGRHHQIRAQLSAKGWFIRGDLKYGAKRSNPDGSICLHSRMLQFRHPVSGENLKIVADVPSLPEWTYFGTGLIDS